MAASLREMYEQDADARRVIDVARGLEGLRRQDGIHAAAVVITDEPLTDYLPIQRKPENGTPPEEAPVVTQYEMHGVEELGLLKMDFLGLRNLSVIERALDLVEQTTGRRPDVDEVPLDDPATYRMLQRGDSIGVFQLEGGPMRALLRSLAPTAFDDVAALVGLYRPGPMAANMHNEYADRKCGRRPITYLHPDLEPLLGDTYGLMIYQESMLRVAQRFAGYSLAEADNLRKACGKKIRSLIAAEREKFVAGCEQTGYGRELGGRLFDLIEPFADYAFNKSHSYGYGLVAYQTAWLKATYPVQYLAALLTSVQDDKDKTAIYLAECRSLGIRVLVPDVNLSEAEFTARPATTGEGEEGQPGTIVFGLAAVRNVGAGLVGHIVAERGTGGPYRDFFDFCDRVDPMVLNKRTVESLVKAGAFDSLGHPRKGLLHVFEQVVDQALSRRREQAAGILSLFDGLLEPQGGVSPFDGRRVPVPGVEFDKTTRLAFEKEMLGLYVSDHPLLGLEAAVRRLADCSITGLREQGPGGAPGSREGELTTVAGVVTSLTVRYTRRGERMASFVLEDLESQIETLVFPKAMQSCGHLLDEDAIVCVKGRLDTRDDQPKLVCMELSRPELVAAETLGAEPLRVQLSPGALSDQRLVDLKALLLAHPGRSPVLLCLGDRVLRLPPQFSVEPRAGLLGELRELLGAGVALS
jgi:DNA polymerase-3 subunit alpha